VYAACLGFFGRSRAKQDLRIYFHPDHFNGSITALKFTQKKAAKKRSRKKSKS
jgi:hypothetical protein